MQPIDRPFRLTLDFCVVWSLLAVPAYFLIRRADMGPWYSQASAFLLLSLFSTFALYGPVLLLRQIIRSGSRGRFVARVLLSILLCAGLLFGGLWVSGDDTETRARILAVVFMSIATWYLHLRLEQKPFG